LLIIQLLKVDVKLLHTFNEYVQCK